jgi:hydrogenase nickel incorporation protein HypA/HybF
MHEMGIAMEIIRIARESVPAGLADARIERVHLKVGKLSLIVADSLRFCFEVATRQTPLESAQLVIEEIPAAARCRDCAHQWVVETPVFICPLCHGGRIDLISGRELDIDSIEIITGENSDAELGP